MLIWIHYLCKYGIEGLKFGLFYKKVLSLEYRKEKTGYLLTVITWMLFSLFVATRWRNENLLLVYLLFIIIESFLCVQISWNKLLQVCILASAVIGIMDSAIEMMASICMDMGSIEFGWPQKCVASLGTIAFLDLFGKFLKDKNDNIIEKLSMGYFLVFIVIGYAEGTVLGFFKDNVIAAKNYYNRLLMSIVFVIAGVGVLLQMAMVFWLAVSRNVYREKDVMNQSYLNTQKQYYQHLEKRESETRKFRHDERNHLYYIRELSEKGENKKLVEYIDQLWTNLECFSKEIRVNNGIVDAILNRYVEMGKEEGVSIQVKGHMPKECRIDDFDLCTVFSNLLSNALEAARETEEKQVYLTVRYDEQVICIYEENTFLGERKIKNGKIYTKKKNKAYHGYGLLNMQDSVNKYDGSLDIKIEGQVCKVFIAMKNQKVNK